MTLPAWLVRTRKKPKIRYFQYDGEKWAELPGAMVFFAIGGMMSMLAIVGMTAFIGLGALGVGAAALLWTLW